MAVAVLGFGFTFTMILIGSLTCDGGKGNSGKVTLIYTCSYVCRVLFCTFLCCYCAATHFHVF